MEGAGQLPFARSERLVVEELGDELLVYDLDVKHAHCLTPTAARVWRRCDGRTSPDAIADGLGLDAVEIARALDELERCELLMPAVVVTAGVSRRDFGLKVTKVAAAAATVPLILSIAAPAAAQTQTQRDICEAISTARGCGECNDGGNAGGPCCCCQPGGGSKKVCKASATDCATDLGGKCTEGKDDVTEPTATEEELQKTDDGFDTTTEDLLPEPGGTTGDPVPGSGGATGDPVPGSGGATGDPVPGSGTTTSDPVPGSGGATGDPAPQP